MVIAAAWADHNYLDSPVIDFALGEYDGLPRMTPPCRGLLIASLVLMSAAFTSCEKGSRLAKDETHSPLASSVMAPILLFNGTGTSPNDVAAIESILNNNQLQYSSVDSSQLNAMDEAQIRQYRLLILPAGNFIDIGNNLTSSTSTNLRNAVHNGLSYLGICAGAFFAGNSGFNGLNLTSNVRFSFYAAESRGIRKAAVPIAGSASPTLDQCWEDGPQLTGWGAVVGKYPDGTPAIAEGIFGSGWVILSGVHPEAPESWRRGMTFTPPASVDNAFAGKLINAALTRTSLSQD